MEARRRAIFEKRKDAETAMEERRRVPEDAEWVQQLSRRAAYLELLDLCGDRPQLRRLVWRHTLSPDNATMKCVA